MTAVESPLRSAMRKLVRVKRSPIEGTRVDGITDVKG